MKATAKIIDKVFYQAEFVCDLGNNGYSKVTGIGGNFVHGISATAQDGFVHHGWKFPVETWDDTFAHEFKVEPKEDCKELVDRMISEIE